MSPPRQQFVVERGTVDLNLEKVFDALSLAQNPPLGVVEAQVALGARVSATKVRLAADCLQPRGNPHGRGLVDPARTRNGDLKRS
jgi:hypothetical protein